MNLSEALEQALADVDTRPQDAATVALARTYAARLDDGKDAPLLAVLESLGMTPRARAAITGKGGASHDSGPNPLDVLRAKRAARTHTAEAVHAPAP